MNIIVTGASRGIGFEIVKYFIQNTNHKVLAIARDQQKLSLLNDVEASGNYKNRIFPFAFDLVNDNYKEVLLPFFADKLGNIDILINNAGFLINKKFGEFNHKDFDDIFNANVKTVFNLSQFLLPYFNKNSHIVNIGSMGGFQGSVKFPGLSLYSSSKAAVAVISECMAEELKEKKIKVNCLCLGSANTEMLHKAFPGYQAPLNANEISKFIVDFALNAHHYINGKILPISLSTP